MGLWEFGRSTGATQRALLLSEILLEGPPGAERVVRREPFGWRHGICGVGVFALEPDHVVPCVFLHETGEVKKLEARTDWRNSNAWKAVEGLFGGDTTWLGDTVAVSVSTTKLSVNAGDVVHTHASNGELGTQVAWGNNQRGFLGCGHVGQMTGTDVFAGANTRIGKVVFALDPTGKAHTPGVDVAVIELAQGFSAGSTPLITTVATPNPCDSVGCLHPKPHSEASLDLQQGFLVLCFRFQYHSRGSLPVRSGGRCWRRLRRAGFEKSWDGRNHRSHLRWRNDDFVLLGHHLPTKCDRRRLSKSNHLTAVRREV